jgi:hypothetical protein
MMNILTFDIEEWFHCDFISGDENWLNYEVRIRKNTDFILKILSKHNRKATFFILGWVADKYPERLKKLTESYMVSNVKLKKYIVKELPLTSKQGIIKTLKSFKN